MRRKVVRLESDGRCEEPGRRFHDRGGNRDANRALWVIAIVRMASDPTTQRYVQRRTHEGLSKKEILRCLKRYIARQLYRLLLGPIAPTGASLAA